MNIKLYNGVIQAIDWMRDHIHEYPDLLGTLTKLEDGEKAERADPNDSRTAMWPANIQDQNAWTTLVESGSLTARDADAICYLTARLADGNDVIGSALGGLLLGWRGGKDGYTPGLAQGSQVECVDASDGANFLRPSQRYTVESLQIDSSGGLRLNLVGMARAWEASRFRLI